MNMGPYIAPEETSLGYACLLSILAGMTEEARVARAREKRWFDPGLQMWAAKVHFRSADMLMRGENPWAPIPRHLAND
jgi:hypothetical protein